MRTYLFKRLLLDLFYPNRCGFCGCDIPFDEYFCNNCINRFTPFSADAEIADIDEFKAVTVYDSFSRPFISEIKKENNGYAVSGASYLIYKALASEDGLTDFDVITFVPMRKKDIYRRGYNQTRLMAKELSWLTDKPCTELLKKIKDTRLQKSLKAKERRENVKGAFACVKGNRVKGKTVLIVDDVSTTGSTLTEAARVLKAAGAKSVKAAVFAKTKGYSEKVSEKVSCKNS